MAVEDLDSFLFSPAIIDSITAEEAKGIYTAERCPKDKRDAIIELLGRDWSKRRIENLLGTHRLTINAVEERFCNSVDAVRERTKRRMRRCVSDQLDRLEENPGIIPPNSIAMTIGVLTDKAELLDGRATVRVEEVKRVDIYSDWPAFVEKVLEPGQDVREIGLSVEKNPPIELADRDPRSSAGTVPADGRSEDRLPIAQQSQSDVTTSDPGARPAATPGSELEEAPRGGDAAGHGQQNCPTHKGAQKILGNRTNDS